MGKRRGLRKRLTAGFLVWCMLSAMFSSAAFAEEIMIPEADGNRIYANGAAIRIVAGDNDGYTNILYDKDGSGTIEDDEYLKIGDTEPDSGGYDLSRYTIYGGAKTAVVDETSVEMTGGVVKDVYGGGKKGEVSYASVQIDGGKVTSAYGGGEKGDILNFATVSINGGTVETAYGGGKEGDAGKSGVYYGGGEVTTIYGGAESGDVNETRVIVTGSGAATVYGGGEDGNVLMVARVGMTDYYPATAKNIYGGGKYGDTVAAVLAIDRSSVQGDIYMGSERGTAHQVLSIVQDSTATGDIYAGKVTESSAEAKLLIVAGDTSIGNGSSKGIRINGGAVTSGVDIFYINPGLTGADGGVTVVLPEGFAADSVIGNIYEEGVITDSDVKKIKLAGSGADGLSAYLEDNAIKAGVREDEKPEVPDDVYIASASNAVMSGKYEVKQSTAEDSDSFCTELVSQINKILAKLFGTANMENITAEDIVNLEITTPPVAGVEEDISGTDGAFSFDVEIHKGEESSTLEGISGTIKATPYKDEEQEEKDQEAVADAKTAIESSDYVFAQKKAKNAAALRRALKSKAEKKAGEASVSEILIVEAEYAIAGTKDNPEGTGGSFIFKARIKKGDIEIWTDEIEGTINPDKYVLKKPVITTDSLPDGLIGTEYDETLTAKSDETVVWTVTGGNLPDGLMLDEDGSLAGMPEQAGQFTFTVSADNGSERGTAKKTYTIKINPPSDAETYMITASAGSGGSISPSGEVAVESGGEQRFTITASSQHYISDVLVDGISVGRVTTYTFSNVTGEHTIEAVFERGSVGPTADESSDNGDSTLTSDNTVRAPSTTTSTAAAENGGSITTTLTTFKDRNNRTTRVTTQVTKDVSGNVTGSMTTVITDCVQVTAGEGIANIFVSPDEPTLACAAAAAGATQKNPLGMWVNVPSETVNAQLQKPEISSVVVELVVPASLSGSSSNVRMGVILPKESVQTAAALGKGLSVVVRDGNGTVKTVWVLSGQSIIDAAGRDIFVPVTNEVGA